MVPLRSTMRYYFPRLQCFPSKWKKNPHFGKETAHLESFHFWSCATWRMLGPTPGDLSSLNPSKIHGSSDTHHSERQARRIPEVAPAKPKSAFETEPLKYLLKLVARAQNSAEALSTASHLPTHWSATALLPQDSCQRPALAWEVWASLSSTWGGKLSGRKPQNSSELPFC